MKKGPLKLLNLLSLVAAVMAGISGAARAGEIVKRDVYYYGTDSVSSQYVFQGGKRNGARLRYDDTYSRLAPRYRPVRSNAGVRYCYYVPPFCAYPVRYRPRCSSGWFYPGGNRSVVRIEATALRR